jgi:hypothetical protein
MKNLITLFAVAALFTGQSAFAGPINDTGASAYWGADSHGYGDVIGDSSFDIDGATISRSGSVLTVTIATKFAGHAGVDTWAAPGGIGYGDVFLSQAWTPYGSDANHAGDNAANGTHWSYGFSLDDRWNNAGGTFRLFKLTGADNAAAIQNSESLMSCLIGSQCYYRNGQAVAVDTGSDYASDTGIAGTWSVTADELLSFSIDVASTDLARAGALALHWGETCQNDVVEGSVDLPLPGSLSLMALGSLALMARRRRV